jgi:hypothetical protein
LIDGASLRYGDKSPAGCRDEEGPWEFLFSEGFSDYLGIDYRRATFLSINQRRMNSL